MEPLSAASSVFAVVSVAIEVAKGINKLVDFCRAVQDAPSGLQSLVEDLEGLRELLEQVHCVGAGVGVEDTGSDKYIGSAVEKCRSVLRRLEEKVGRPSRDLGSEKRGRRFRGKVKLVLGRVEIGELREEVERAKSQLQIAQINALM